MTSHSLNLSLNASTSNSTMHTQTQTNANLSLQRCLTKCSSPCCKNRAASFSVSSEAFSSCCSRASPVKNLRT